MGGWVSWMVTSGFGYGLLVDRWWAAHPGKACRGRSSSREAGLGEERDRGSARPGVERREAAEEQLHSTRARQAQVRCHHINILPKKYFVPKSDLALEANPWRFCG